MLTRLRISFPLLASELAAELYCDEVLDGSGYFQDLDRVISMRALEDEDEPASTTDQHDRREFHNGF